MDILGLVVESIIKAVAVCMIIFMTYYTYAKKWRSSEERLGMLASPLYQADPLNEYSTKWKSIVPQGVIVTGEKVQVTFLLPKIGSTGREDADTLVREYTFKINDEVMPTCLDHKKYFHCIEV